MSDYKKKNQDFAKLEEFMCVYVESAKEEREREGERVNLKLRCRTTSGILPLKYWKPENQNWLPLAGDYLLVNVFSVNDATAELEKYKCLCLDKIWENKIVNCGVKKITRDDVPEEIRDVIKRDRNAPIALAKKTILDLSPWKEKRNHDFLIRFMEDNWDRFGNIPAAINNHHNYKGGLLVHSCEVFEICIKVINSSLNQFRSKPLDSDALYLAAWLHDAGKMDIYSMEGEQAKIDSKKETLIGHITISNLMFVRAAVEFGGFNEEFIEKISHCILSHHGRHEWKAVVEPQSPEAHILHHADMISSKMWD